MPVPTGTPSAATPDLTVKAIKLNGRVPDGKDDCKPGKNVVTVTVKNGGNADAGSFVVSLSEDLADVALGEQTVDGLKIGQEREVRFEGVRLKKGTQKIEAYADYREKVSESSKDNNGLMVTASCKDDD
jgi:subtilase family serine protease